MFLAWGKFMHHHSYIHFLNHIVWSTKDRLPLIESEYKKDLDNFIGRVLVSKNCNLLAIGGVCDHIHLLVHKTHTNSLSDIMRALKASSSKFIREKFNPIFAWQTGFSAFSVDLVSLPRIKQYILNQEKHHQKMNYEKEHNLLLKRYKEMLLEIEKAK